MHNRVVKLEPPENLLRTAQELAEEAQKFLNSLEHAQEDNFYDRLAVFSRKVLPLLNEEIGRKMQTVFNSTRKGGVPRTVATETHVLVIFATGHRSPQQYQRVRALLQVFVDLPAVCKPQHQRLRRHA